ncbi:MAG: hypothetical protein ACK4RF_08705 [Cyclobacteriaceae bacterium]
MNCSCFIFIVLFGALAGQAFSQTEVARNFLPAKDIRKVEAAGMAREKLKQYKKLYAKDSLRRLKEEARNLRKRSDSLWRLREHLPDSSGLTIDSTYILGHGVQLPDSITNLLAVDSIAGFRDLLTDSLADYSQLAKMYKDKYAAYGNVDTVKRFVRSEASGWANNYIENLLEIKELKQYDEQVKNFRPLQNEYKRQVEALNDSAYRKEQARKIAEEIAADYLATHPEIMQPAKKKFDGLMKKYAVVPNSSDLSSARKRTSLQGYLLRERLYVATNFQVLSIRPFSIDFAPAVGYRFTARLVAGTGVTIRKTFDQPQPDMTPEVFGYKVFGSYDILSTFFVYSEVARNSTLVTINDQFSAARIWELSLAAGIGRQFLIHPKIEMTLLVTYDFLHKPGNITYPSPWSIRVGFQLSELALLKKRPNLGKYQR